MLTHSAATSLGQTADHSHQERDIEDDRLSDRRAGVVTSFASPSCVRALRTGLGLGGAAVRLILRIVRRVAEPQPMQEDRELAGDGDDRALLRMLSAAVRDGVAEPPQIAVGTNAMVNGMEQRNVGPALAREKRRIEPIIAVAPPAVAGRRTRIRDEGLVAALLEQTGHPRGMGANLQHDATPRPPAEIPLHPGGRRGDRRLTQSLTARIELVHLTHLIAKVQSDNATLSELPPGP